MIAEYPPHLKCAATLPCDFLLITVHFTLSLFSDLNISQGSVVTPLRYVGMFKNASIANLLRNLSMQEFGKSAFGEVTDNSLSVLFWFTV